MSTPRIEIPPRDLKPGMRIARLGEDLEVEYLTVTRVDKIIVKDRISAYRAFVAPGDRSMVLPARSTVEIADERLEPDLLASLEREIIAHTTQAAKEARWQDFVMAQGHAIIAAQRAAELRDIITSHIPNDAPEGAQQT